MEDDETAGDEPNPNDCPNPCVPNVISVFAVGNRNAVLEASGTLDDELKLKVGDARLDDVDDEGKVKEGAAKLDEKVKVGDARLDVDGEEEEKVKVGDARLDVVVDDELKGKEGVVVFVEENEGPPKLDEVVKVFVVNGLKLLDVVLPLLSSLLLSLPSLFSDS